MVTPRPAGAWPPLLGAIAVEVAATLSLRAFVTGAGWGWILVVAGGYAAAFWLLGVVLARGMAVGVAYGVWSAIGVATTALAAAALFGEALNLLSLVGIMAIVLGVLMVELGGRHSARESA